MKHYDVIIVGGGPCGIACALHLVRGHLTIGIIEKKRFGGLIWNARKVDNYPGFPGGVSGQRLGSIFKEHLFDSEVEPISDEILRIEEGEGYNLIGCSGNYSAEYVVLATGTRPRKMELDFPKLYYELCEVPEHVKRILIIGGGDIAFDYALSCDDRGMDVTLLLRSQPRAHPLLIEEVKGRSGIKIMDGIRGISIRDEKLMIQMDSCNQYLDADAVLVSIGRVPEDSPVQMVTDGKNLFHAGSIRFPSWLRHTGIAIGDGIRIACEILLREEGNGDSKKMGR